MRCPARTCLCVRRATTCRRAAFRVTPPTSWLVQVAAGSAVRSSVAPIGTSSLWLFADRSQSLPAISCPPTLTLSLKLNTDYIPFDGEREGDRFDEIVGLLLAHATGLQRS